MNTFTYESIYGPFVVIFFGWINYRLLSTNRVLERFKIHDDKKKGLVREEFIQIINELKDLIARMEKIEDHSTKILSDIGDENFRILQKIDELGDIRNSRGIVEKERNAQTKMVAALIASLPIALMFILSNSQYEGAAIFLSILVVGTIYFVLLPRISASNEKIKRVRELLHKRGIGEFDD